MRRGPVSRRAKAARAKSAGSSRNSRPSASPRRSADASHLLVFAHGDTSPSPSPSPWPGCRGPVLPRGLAGWHLVGCLPSGQLKRAAKARQTGAILPGQACHTRHVRGTASLPDRTPQDRTYQTGSTEERIHQTLCTLLAHRLGTEEKGHVAVSRPGLLANLLRPRERESSPRAAPGLPGLPRLPRLQTTAHRPPTADHDALTMRLCACDRVWLQLQLFVVAAAAAAAATAPALRFTHPSFARVEAGSSVKVSFAGASGPVGLALQRARADAAGSDADAYVIAGKSASIPIADGPLARPVLTALRTRRRLVPDLVPPADTERRRVRPGARG